MAIYRTVHLSFWTDAKVDEDFTPEDKYFYLYLLTNPHTNLLGCYEVGRKQMAIETGYDVAVIDKLIARFEEVHKIVRYSKSTKEVLVLNWSKYNWTASPKLLVALKRELEGVKDKRFKGFLIRNIQDIDTVSTPYAQRSDTTVTVTDTVTNTVLNNNTEKQEDDIQDIKSIVDYLNEKCGTAYRSTTDKTKKTIRARFRDGFTLDDFKTVIDKKHKEWAGTEWEKFLRPETLFGTKFESYLNQKGNKPKGNMQTDAIERIREWGRRE